MSALPTGHVTAATRALLDHIDTHGLAFPAEIVAPYPSQRDRLAVYVTHRHDAQPWLSSLLPDGPEENTQRRSAYDGTPYYRTVLDGRLPDTGVRIRLTVLREVPLALVPTTGTSGVA